MFKSRGMTLIELMVTVAILAVLVRVAAPSFQNIITSTNVTSSVNTFMGDLRFARSEAVRRGSNVVMCRTETPESATPACGTGAGTDGNGWVSGWVIFEDRDGDGTRSTGDIILRAQSRMNSAGSIMDGSNSTKFVMTPLGRQKALSSAATLTFGGDIANSLQRVVCVNWTGRARVAGDGNSSCGTGSTVN